MYSIFLDKNTISGVKKNIINVKFVACLSVFDTRCLYALRNCLNFIYCIC